MNTQDAEAGSVLNYERTILERNPMVATSETLHGALQNYFGFDGFKGNQEQIIKSILASNDTFVIMPTGGGKSLCYQLPGLDARGHCSDHLSADRPDEKPG
jgi:superfamily II DNA helicase RecQ